MVKIIHQSKRVTNTSHDLFFEWRTDPGAGFSFPCNEAGQVDAAKLKPAARANFASCLDGSFDVVACGVRTSRNSYTEPAVGVCSCGVKVELGGFTNTCHGCGADYNWNGNLLAHRSLWDGTDGAGSHGYQ